MRESDGGEEIRNDVGIKLEELERRFAAAFIGAHS